MGTIELMISLAHVQLIKLEVFQSTFGKFLKDRKLLGPFGRKQPGDETGDEGFCKSKLNLDVPVTLLENSWPSLAVGHKVRLGKLVLPALFCWPL